MDPKIMLLILRGYRLMRIHIDRDVPVGLRITPVGEFPPGVVLAAYLPEYERWSITRSGSYSCYEEIEWSQLPSAAVEAIDLGSPFFNP